MHRTSTDWASYVSLRAACAIEPAGDVCPGHRAAHGLQRSNCRSGATQPPMHAPAPRPLRVHRLVETQHSWRGRLAAHSAPRLPPLCPCAVFWMVTGASPYAGLAPFQVGGWAVVVPCLPPSGACTQRRSALLAACAPCQGVQPRLLAGFLACLRPVCHPCAASREGALQVVGRKLEEAHKKAPLGMPPTVPASLQRLVWDCTHWDPCARCGGGVGWGGGRGSEGCLHAQRCPTADQHCIGFPLRQAWTGGLQGVSVHLAAAQRLAFCCAAAPLSGRRTALCDVCPLCTLQTCMTWLGPRCTTHHAGLRLVRSPTD